MCKDQCNQGWQWFANPTMADKKWFMNKFLVVLAKNGQFGWNKG